ncbi:MAG TPA: DUF4190 domain-containing protein [Firmicutes bacterium]|nr:DUF4190 domain-containing protein [Bacillota bacterium]
MGKRYAVDFNTGKPDDFIRFVSEDFLRKEGFALVTYRGESVWKKGQGLLTAPQFIKLQYAGGAVHLEAWIKWAVLPGVYCGEMGLDGAMGFAVKAALRKRVDMLVALLYQPANISAQPAAPVGAVPVPPPGAAVSAQPIPAAVQEAPVSQGAAQPAPYPGTPAGAHPPAPAEPGSPAVPGGVPSSAYPPASAYAPPPIPVAVHNPTGKATLALVMGLCSALGCWIPVAGVIMGIIGIVSGVIGRKSTARGMATAGLALSVAFFILSVLNWIAGILLHVI